ncbi:hypothetical protein [Bacillus sp. FJAT-27445]|uniref:hypothetical protein n=1 Tax=Bacillus sp. FJAT-27445 TaxID=1679166 RepID=UPI000ACD9344|nr:hypothetical protein [Bacillus sp. FJAT-27445]
MKSIKAKIVTGAVAVGLLSGVGAAFANTDAGIQLQAWYNNQFKNSETLIAQESATYFAQKSGAFQTEYNGIKAKVTTDINEIRDSATTASTGVINTTRDNYITQVNNKKTGISNEMAAQFDAIFNLANLAINVAGNTTREIAYFELKNQARNDGKAALLKVENDLNAAQAAAKTELEAAIQNAKEELTVQLNGETQATTQEIKDAIDTKINELRTLITERANTLLKEQQNAIQKRASDLENSAKQELENVVKGI